MVPATRRAGCACSCPAPVCSCRSSCLALAAGAAAGCAAPCALRSRPTHFLMCISATTAPDTRLHHTGTAIEIGAVQTVMSAPKCCQCMSADADNCNGRDPPARAQTHAVVQWPSNAGRRQSISRSNVPHRCSGLRAAAWFVSCRHRELDSHTLSNAHQHAPCVRQRSSGAAYTHLAHVRCCALMVAIQCWRSPGCGLACSMSERV